MNPHVYELLSQKRLSIMGVQGGNAPLKILLNSKIIIPLPRQRGNILRHGLGAGGGRGWASNSFPTGRRDQGVGFANLPPADKTGVDIPNPAHEAGEIGVSCTPPREKRKSLPSPGRGHLVISREIGIMGAVQGKRWPACPTPTPPCGSPLG